MKAYHTNVRWDKLHNFVDFYCVYAFYHTLVLKCQGTVHINRKQWRYLRYCNISQWIYKMAMLWCTLLWQVTERFYPYLPGLLHCNHTITTMEYTVIYIYNIYIYIYWCVYVNIHCQYISQIFCLRGFSHFDSNGPSPKSWRAMIWIIYDPGHWCMYVSPGIPFSYDSL